MKRFKGLFVFLAAIGTAQALSAMTRRESLRRVGGWAAAVGVGAAGVPPAARADAGDVFGAAQRASQITYSSNARNFARMGEYFFCSKDRTF